MNASFEKFCHGWQAKGRRPVAAILEDSALNVAMPEWSDIDLTWAELNVLPTRWKSALSGGGESISSSTRPTARGTWARRLARRTYLGVG